MIFDPNFSFVLRPPSKGLKKKQENHLFVFLFLTANRLSERKHVIKRRETRTKTTALIASLRLTLMTFFTIELINKQRWLLKRRFGGNSFLALFVYMGDVWKLFQFAVRSKKRRSICCQNSFSLFFRKTRSFWSGCFVHVRFARVLFLELFLFLKPITFYVLRVSRRAHLLCILKSHHSYGFNKFRVIFWVPSRLSKFVEVRKLSAFALSPLPPPLFLPFLLLFFFFFFFLLI